MQFLLTNDDGIDAPGLQALERAARILGGVAVVAPAACHSGCGHRVTTAAPIRLEQHGPGRLAVHGTPADCVRVALHQNGTAFDWVLAGINAGGNLGADVHHSGTVAAVREAVLHGRPGIALSHYRRRGLAYDWDRVALWTVSVLRDLMARPWTPGSFWNVNLPHLDASDADPAIRVCPLDTFPLPLSYRRDGDLLVYDGDYHGRQRQPGSDVDVCFRGGIAVTRLSLGAEA
jgi:5'-nucleotidase